MKKFLIAGLASLCLATSVAGLTACSSCNSEPPEAQEGTIYQTSVETFWVGVGKAYMAFEKGDEGYVFNVNVDSGNGYSSWLTGEWSLVEGGSLTLTAEWDANAENPTYLADAESGVAKEYTLSDGVYTIGVNLPSAGVVNFELDPVADKVGEGETPEPELPECTEHKDENGDGKCDVCGENMPEEGGEEGELLVTLSATDSATSMAAEIQLYDNNTFDFNLAFMGGKVFGGTWQTTDASNPLAPVTLMVDETGAATVGQTITVNIEYVGGENPVKYSCHVDYVVPGTIEMSFDFTGYLGAASEPDPEPTPDPEPDPEPGEALYTSNVASIYSGQGSAYLALEGDNIFNVYVTFGGATSSWLSGTWAIENDVLTVTLSDSSPVVCSLTDKAYTVSLSLPGAEVDFVIDMDEDSVTYTVNYMLNDGSGEVYDTAQIKGNPAEAYITAAPTAPVRAGYHFAGWHTKAEITENDIVNGVSKYLWLFGQKLSSTGIAKYSQMSDEDKAAREISEEVMLLDSADADGTVTLYARWVQEKEISDAQGLKDIANDLYGAYKLTADITLSGAWEPIGAYFANYEYYNTEWWTYAFRGTLNGNGKTINGLNITSAEHGKDYSSEGSVWHDDGVTCDGTAAMFSALAGANISDLTIVSPVIDVTYSGDYLYVGSLASFDMTSTLSGIIIQDCQISANFDDSEITYRDNLFTAVGGLEAGGWTNNVSSCEVTGVISLNAVNKLSHGGEIYLGGLLGENYSTMTGCKTDVALDVEYKDKGTESEDKEIVINVGGLSGSGTSITGCDVKMSADVKAVKASGLSSVNVGGIVGSQRYLTTSGNTVEGAITTECTLDEQKGALNVGGVGGRIDVYYMLQILAYTSVASAGAENNVQNVTVNGVETDAIIADAVSAVPDCWYIAKGDQLGGAAPSNIDEVIAAYGSYLPKDRLQDGIIYIMNTPATAE